VEKGPVYGLCSGTSPKILNSAALLQTPIACAIQYRFAQKGAGWRAIKGGGLGVRPDTGVYEKAPHKRDDLVATAFSAAFCRKHRAYN